jgi:DMSO/TMAO reductase YedYZ molybdopterin-dependent catalytic subunit
MVYSQAAKKSVMWKADTLSRREFLLTATHGRHDFSVAQLNAQQFSHIPVIDRDSWSLTLGGLVEQSLVLTFDNLLALDTTEIPCTLVCCGHDSGNSTITGHGLWRSVRVRSLLEGLMLQPGANFARFDGADGYSTSVALPYLDDALIATGFNGAELSSEHGFPARLIIPGLYGYKLPKWITRIEFSSQRYMGFWEQRGWSQTGLAQTTAAILRPYHLAEVRGTITLAGMAYAGIREITSIAVNIDDGPWMPVPFVAGTRGSQIAWQINWKAPAPADYAVNIQATDSSGFTYTGSQPVILRIRG